MHDRIESSIKDMSYYEMGKVIWYIDWTAMLL